MDIMNILLATNNAHKAGEIRSALSDFAGVRVITPAELADPIPEPEEDGRTLEENAYIKAREIHDATGMPVVADDTGLEVQALDGAPGVFSARYAGPQATYRDNCRALLKALADTPAEQRAARFRTVLCYVDAERTLFAEGSVQGTILDEERGEEGFGYDPVFQPEGSKKTFAEMSLEEKNAISHRGNALRAFRDVIAPYIAERHTGTGAE